VVPGLIVAHLPSEVQGREGANGETQRALMTLVIELRDSDWKIVAAHNTLVVTPTA
jgi:hypothetical protein